ncbi:hypothetical protein [Paludisphaera mucosa]|uniref:Uncharacterized protein n=1 Tax=Paludisphaera mucosa TaxID=3030827 RepID=A0ABT6FL41_9BACT|nr:hypothetical protein [Paludisphaera mucosa]MDG3008296.1 hypothetical protein [Paludisphaera mucosa]
MREQLRLILIAAAAIFLDVSGILRFQARPVARGPRAGGGAAGLLMGGRRLHSPVLVPKSRDLFGFIHVRKLAQSVNTP